MLNKKQGRCVQLALQVMVWCACTSLSSTALAQQETAQDPLKEVQLASDRFTRGGPIPTWVEPVAALPTTQSKHPLVFLLSDTQYLVNAQDGVFVHRAWQINDSAALGQFAQYPLGFQANYQRLQLHRLRIHRSGQVKDQTQTAKIRFLQREQRLEDGIYNGEVTASILIEDLRVGDTLEVAYSRTGTNPVFQGKHSEFAGWDYGTPTELRRVIHNHPVDRHIQWRVLGDLKTSIPAPVESIISGMRKLRWEERNLPPLQEEKFVPESFFPARSLQFSDYRDWEEVSRWASEMFETRAPMTGELQQLLQRLRTLPTAEQQVSAALSWVQKEIRYFSVSLGESTHRPHAPNETLARRYGDCKDKSFLLIELLRALGVPAQPVMVSAGTRTGPAKMLPSPHAFDHAIVRVQLGGRDYFLDPTLQGQGGRLDRMGQPHEGSLVLVAQPGNNALTTITSPNRVDLTRDELQETIRLPKFGGEGTLVTRTVWKGMTADLSRIGIAQLTRDQLEKFLMEPYENRYPGIRRATNSVVEDDAENNVLVVTSSYVIPNLAISAGGDWGIRFGTTNMRGSLRAPPSATRTQPMALPSLPRILQYNLEIEFPPEAAVISDPSTAKVNDPAFDFTISYTFRGNRATAAATMHIYQPEVQARDTQAFMAALRRVDEVTRTYFIVRKNEIKSAGFFGLGSKTLQQLMQDRLQERIEKLSKTIDSGKLSGDDLAGAYCDRAEALLDLGRSEEGMKDAQLAVKKAPNMADSYSCRGSAWFLQGDYTRSAADYSKAITLGQPDFMPYYRRGHARFYGGQLQAALADFTQARNLKTGSGGDEDDALYAELWRVWTQKRLGQLPDAEQRKHAAENPRGNWPRPALAMLHDLLSVEEVLQLIDRSKKGDEREMTLTEAYFYIGQHYYAQGDKAKAQDYFRKTREKGITMYIEHVGAGAELRQMGLLP
ncbi:MAG: DUF3857 domain-containing protein [Burkholderiales bacterium]|nr:DUF3857 domain-containing protein [Burkholderiales bacterium]